jgi:hypothetical protein
LPIMSATAQKDRQKLRYRHLGPPWYSPPISAHSGTEPLRGLCHSSHNGRQTVENPCGLHFAFQPTDRSGHVRLFLRGNTGLDGRQPQHQTHALELAVEHKMGTFLRDYADGKSCLIFEPYTRTTNPYNPLATRDVLDIVIKKNLTSLVYLTSCSALSLGHLPVLIDTTCRTLTAKFQTHLKIKFRLVRNYTTEWQ